MSLENIAHLHNLALYLQHNVQLMLTLRHSAPSPCIVQIQHGIPSIFEQWNFTREKKGERERETIEKYIINNSIVNKNETPAPSCQNEQWRQKQQQQKSNDSIDPTDGSRSTTTTILVSLLLFERKVLTLGLAAIHDKSTSISCKMWIWSEPRKQNAMTTIYFTSIHMSMMTPFCPTIQMHKWHWSRRIGKCKCERLRYVKLIIWTQCYYCHYWNLIDNHKSASQILIPLNLAIPLY